MGNDTNIKECHVAHHRNWMLSRLEMRYASCRIHIKVGIIECDVKIVSLARFKALDRTNTPQ